MLELKNIKLEDKETLESYLNIHRFHNSEYNFTTLFAWQEVYNIRYTIVHDCLCLFGEDRGKKYCYFPLGKKENLPAALYDICLYFKEIGEVFRLISLSEKMLFFFRDNNLYPFFEITAQRGFYDYVYKRGNFTELKGKKLHGKRNHFNYFINNYEHSMRDITEENEQACEEKLHALIYDRSKDSENEFVATRKALRCRDGLGLIGKALYVDEDIVGVILGQEHHGMALLEIAKADIEYRGASVALFHFYLKDNLLDCEEANLMEDMGLEGLRSVKQSYNPEYMIEKYSLKADPDILLRELAYVNKILG